MENNEISQIITNIVNLLEIKGDNPFRLRAYKNAIEIIENLPFSLTTAVSEGKRLEEIDGIGKNISDKIYEIVETGTCHTLVELLETYPEGLLEMLRLSGMGPKKVKLVFEELGASSIRQLERAVKAGKLQELPGMGVKTEEKIQKAIEEYRSVAGDGRFTLPIALSYAHSIIDYLKELPEIERVEYAGSLRRWQETIGDLDILATSTNAPSAMEHFIAYGEVKEVMLSGLTKTTVVLNNNMHVDLRVVDPNAFGAAMQYFTGSKMHNIALRERAVKLGLKISEYGVFKEGEEETKKPLAVASETEVYKTVGLDFIAPEIRVNMGEIEAASSGKLPHVLKESDIKGDLHMHTFESDGSASIAEMTTAALARGYEYIAITEHSKATGIANGLDEKRLLKHIDRIDKFNLSLIEQDIPFRVLKGAEVDIRANGELDYSEEILGRLDIVVGAVHSGFAQRKEQMTRRVVSAVSTGLVDILAHPTGRLIGIRPPYEIDMEEVMKAAKEYGAAMELNCYPERLDLKDTHLKLAKEMGILIAISTDSHNPIHLNNILYGIHTARRAWLEPADVLNTRSTKDLLKLLEVKP